MRKISVPAMLPRRVLPGADDDWNRLKWCVEYARHLGCDGGIGVFGRHSSGFRREYTVPRFWTPPIQTVPVDSNATHLPRGISII